MGPGPPESPCSWLSGRTSALLPACRPAPALQEPWRRERVWQLARRLGQELEVPVSSPIVPLIIGPEQAAVEASMALLQRGLHVPAIRPPTVPRGTSRLRVSLSAAHSEADLAELVAALRACGLRFRGVDSVLGAVASTPLQAGAAAGGAGGAQAVGGQPRGRPAMAGTAAVAAGVDGMTEVLAASAAGPAPSSRL